MDIEFRKINDFPPGILLELLKDGYSFEPRFERDWQEQWQEFDHFFFSNPLIAELSSFMTVLDGFPIGFVSWDPRKLPESAEIGHNCISTFHKGNGYGKRQMQEAVRRILAQGARKILVTTNEILVPAQHTYEAVGFRLSGRSSEPFHPEYTGMRIHYELTAPDEISE